MNTTIRVFNNLLLSVENLLRQQNTSPYRRRQQPQSLTAMLEKLPLASWPVLTGLALVVLIASRLWNRGPSAPGPFLARFTDLWLAYRQRVGKFQEENVELHKKYGTLHV